MFNKYQGSEFKIELMDKLFYSWFNPIYHFIHQTIYILKWIPILWKDRNWDDYFIWEILKQKIKFQREYISKQGIHVRAEIDAKNMRIAELLIERIQDPHKAVEKDWDEILLKYPRPTFIEDATTGYFTMRDRSEEEAKEVKRLMEKEKYMHNQDLDYLFKHLKKHIHEFWD